MKNISVSVYRLNELDPDVKKDVIERSSQILVSHDWFSPIIEGFREDMREYGIINPEAYFSGFYSQGDGACFVCDTIDTDLFLRKLYEEGYDIATDTLLESKNMSIIVQKLSSSFANRYDHENTVASSITYEGEELNENELLKLESVVTNWVREMSQKLYSSLEKYYEELTVDEAIEEFLQDSYFFADGRIADKYIKEEDIEKLEIKEI